MSRLIDADNFKVFLHNLQDAGAEHVSFENLHKFLDEDPTAYDVDKVVEQLEKLKKNYMKARDRTYCRSTETDDCDSCRADHYLEARLSAIDRAIEIMKGGGVNE